MFWLTHLHEDFRASPRETNQTASQAELDWAGPLTQPEVRWLTAAVGSVVVLPFDPLGRLVEDHVEGESPSTMSSPSDLAVARMAAARTAAGVPLWAGNQVEGEIPPCRY